MYKDTLSKSFKLGKVARIVRDIFYTLDYSEIFLPTMDKFSPLLRGGLKTAYDDDFYVIKSDITSHLLSSIVKKGELKLFYVSEVLNGSPKGKWQIGAEWIGGDASTVRRITEHIKIVIKILESLSISDFMIDIGSLRKWRDIILKYNLDKQAIYKAVQKRNISSMTSMNICEEAREELMALLQRRGRSCSGGFEDEIIDQIIKGVYNDCMMIDYGTLRHFDYYEDIVIEIYSQKHAGIIGGGGQYKNKGQECFGFALDLETLAGLAI